MGVVADAALAAGGRATGVITESLAGHEIAHSALDDLHVVTTMHERKALMSELSDAFVMLPGGFGTCEEFMESVTWAQLGIHDKRCGILNVDGFFDDLLAFLGHAVDQGFIRARQVEGLVIADDADALLDAIVGSARDRGGDPRERAACRPEPPQAAAGTSRTSRSSSVSPQSASSAATDG